MRRRRCCARLILAAAMLLAGAAAPAATLSPKMQAKIAAVEPALENYVEKGMAEFDVPGAAVGIVAGDRLVYEKGFGVRRKGGEAKVDPQTVFQIGSTTKAFLATVLAIAVDRGKLEWDERVVDLDPSFMLKDPYVTREFRVYDLLAQRSGLPPYANDQMGPAILAVGGNGLIAILKQTGARLELKPYDGTVFTLHQSAEGRFAAVVASRGDTPVGFAGFEPDARGRLSRLRLTIEGQSYLWRKQPEPATGR